MIIDHYKDKIVQSRSHLQVVSWVKGTLFVVILIAVSMLFMLPTKVLAVTPSAIVHITGSARPPGFSPSFRTIYCARRSFEWKKDAAQPSFRTALP